MKAEFIVQHVATVPGYQKIYLYFSKPTTGLERMLVEEFRKPRYIGGKEPKWSLYVGSPVPQIIEGTVARQWSPSFRAFSWQRFWQQLKRDNPSYSFECRCGTWTRSDKSYLKHKKHCLVMKEFKVFLARVENTQAYKEWLKDEGKAKRKKAKPKTSVKSRARRGKDSSKTTKKKIQRRNTSKS